MPIKDPEKRKAYQREWAAKKYAEASPAWHRAKKEYKAAWRKKKGKEYFRKEYRAYLKKLAEEGRLEDFREHRAMANKDWRNRLFLECLEEIRQRQNPPPPPDTSKGYAGTPTILKGL